MSEDRWQHERFSQFESQNYGNPNNSHDDFYSENGKQQVHTYETPNFGDKSLIGLGLIIFTLIVQFLRMTLGTLSSSDNVSLEDIESSIRTAYWSELFVVTIQIFAVVLIYRDVKELLDYFGYDVDRRNENLVTVIKKVNKKNR